MFPDCISPQGTRYKTMDTSSNSSLQSERSIEEAHEQVDNHGTLLFLESEIQMFDFGDAFLECLYSNPGWDDTIGREVSETKETKERVATESLKVVEMYVKKETPFEWTAEHEELDLERKIEAYNSISQETEITFHEDGINFSGHICVDLDFTKIRVVPPQIVDNVSIEKSSAEPTLTVKINGITLPQNTTEVIDIDSKTTARQMIVKLFQTLRMVNSPRKYILYEYEPQIDETAGTLTKKWTQIADDACPLKIVLNWPIPHSGRALVLQENNTMDMLFDSNEVSLRDIFKEVTGLMEEEVDFEIVENPQTGSFDTTYFEQNSTYREQDSTFREQDRTYFEQDTTHFNLDTKYSELDSSVPKLNRFWRYVLDKNLLPIYLPFLTFLFLMFILICYIAYEDMRSRGTVTRSFTRKLLKKYLDDFLENFLNELEK